MKKYKNLNKLQIYQNLRKNKFNNQANIKFITNLTNIQHYIQRFSCLKIKKK